MNVPAATRLTFIPDIQGSILATLDSGAGTPTKTGYLAYGENVTNTSGTFRFTGRRLDGETGGSSAQPSGLYYQRVRTYSPTWGRFLQADPIGYAAGANLYAYVNNDPLNDTDPLGLQGPAQDVRAEHRAIVAAGSLPESAVEPCFAHAGRAGDEQFLLAFNPFSVCQSLRRWHMARSRPRWARRGNRHLPERRPGAGRRSAAGPSGACCGRGLSWVAKSGLNRRASGVASSSSVGTGHAMPTTVTRRRYSATV